MIIQTFTLAWQSIFSLGFSWNPLNNSSWAETWCVQRTTGGTLVCANNYELFVIILFLQEYCRVFCSTKREDEEKKRKIGKFESQQPSTNLCLGFRVVPFSCVWPRSLKPSKTFPSGFFHWFLISRIRNGLFESKAPTSGISFPWFSAHGQPQWASERMVECLYLG